MTSVDFQTVLPEFVLATYALVALLLAVFGSKDRMAPMMIWVTAGLMAVIGVWISLRGGAGLIGFGGMFIDDGYSRFAKVVILFCGAAVLIMSEGYLGRQNLRRFEYPLLIALISVGMMVMVSANDLMALYMGLELQSVGLYIIAAMRRDSVKSTEAGLKYFVLSAFSSGLLLYGCSLTYGFSGTTHFAGIMTAVGDGAAPLGLLFGLVFIIAGLAFKISAVPFHMWTPDVYEGAPTPVTAFFSTAPKVAAIVLFARVLHSAFGGVVGDWQQIIVLMSVASMILGAIGAIGQSDFKRLMAYSSISHMGYAMIGLATGTAFGVEAMLTYLAVYVTMNIGTFAFIMTMEKDGQPIADIWSLSLYAKAEPLRALALLVLLFSLAGAPPMLGFFVKVNIWRAGIEANLYWLVALSAVASAIGAFYYLRIVYLMYFGAEGESIETGRSPVLWGVLMVSAAAMVVGIVNLFGIEGAAAAAAATLVH